MNQILHALTNWNVLDRPEGFTFLKAVEMWAHSQFAHDSSPEFNQALRQLIDACHTLRRFY